MGMCVSSKILREEDMAESRMVRNSFVVPSLRGDIALWLTPNGRQTMDNEELKELDGLFKVSVTLMLQQLLQLTASSTDARGQWRALLRGVPTGHGFHPKVSPRPS